MSEEKILKIPKIPKIPIEQFHRLPLDVLALLLLDKDISIEQVVALCSKHSRINRGICLKESFWMNRLEVDYPNYREFGLNYKSYKEIYKFLYGLTSLKNRLRLREDILSLYQRNELNLDNNKLTELPKEIGSLTNLQTLYLYNNKLKLLPKEIGSLTNLRELYLKNDKFTELPKEIGRLTNLQYIYLNNDKLMEVARRELPNTQIF